MIVDLRGVDGDIEPQEATASAVILRDDMGRPFAIAKDFGGKVLWCTASDQSEFQALLREYGEEAAEVSSVSAARFTSRR